MIKGVRSNLAPFIHFFLNKTAVQVIVHTLLLNKPTLSLLDLVFELAGVFPQNISFVKWIDSTQSKVAHLIFRVANSASKTMGLAKFSPTVTRLAVSNFFVASLFCKT